MIPDGSMEANQWGRRVITSPWDGPQHWSELLGDAVHWHAGHSLHFWKWNRCSCIDRRQDSLWSDRKDDQWAQNRSRHLGKRSPQLCPFNLLNHVLHDHFGYHCVVSTIITRSSIFMLSYVGLLICEQATQTGLMSPTWLLTASAWRLPSFLRVSQSL